MKRLTKEEAAARRAALEDIRKEYGSVLILKEKLNAEYEDEDYAALAVCRELGF